MRLLLNHVTYNPVGHVLEALKISYGFRLNHPDLEIHVALNKKTATELTLGSNWIHTTYIVDTDDVLQNRENGRAFQEIPKEWDYVLNDSRAYGEYKANTDDPEMDLVEYYLISKHHFQARVYLGDEWDFANYPSTLKCTLDNTITINIPQAARDFVQQYRNPNPKITILMGGSAGKNKYPYLGFWTQVIRQITSELPEAIIFLTGVRKQIAGRTATIAYSDVDITQFQQINSNVVDCFDIGLWNQIALLELSNVLISPHSGFSFLAPTVGTPWLALSWQYGEYYFNHAPFYSVIPECLEYPCYDYPHLGMKKACQERLAQQQKIECADDVFLERCIPDLMRGLFLLLDPTFTYEKALTLHLKKAQGRWQFESPFIDKKTIESLINGNSQQE